MSATFQHTAPSEMPIPTVSDAEEDRETRRGGVLIAAIGSAALGTLVWSTYNAGRIGAAIDYVCGQVNHVAGQITTTANEMFPNAAANASSWWGMGLLGVAAVALAYGVVRDYAHLSRGVPVAEERDPFEHPVTMPEAEFADLDTGHKVYVAAREQELATAA